MGVHGAFVNGIGTFDGARRCTLKMRPGPLDRFWSTGPAAERNGPGEADCRRHSPNAGKQSPAHLLGVFGVAGQFGAQCAVLDDCSPQEERHSEGAERRCEP
jgi:hypothetical protein